MPTELNFSAFSPEERKEKFSELSSRDVLHCGWIPPHQRTNIQAHFHNEIAKNTKRFVMRRQGVYKDSTKVCLWDCWRLAKPNYNMLGMHQITGCCVGAGGGQMLFSLQSADLVKRGDRGSAHIPFWLYPYGVSRTLLGETRQGEGSTGNTFAQAVQKYGHIPADEKVGTLVPTYQEGDGYIWGQNTELKFSIASGSSEEIKNLSKIHLVKTYAVAKNTDDVREGIRNFYGVTCASDWGGLMNCEVKGTPPVLMSRHATTWNHQMSCHAWWDHPTLGEIFHIKNNWGDCHGHDPSGSPPGGFWTSKKDMQYIIDQNEVIIFSQFDEFEPVEEILNFSAF
jgi:hypothetical protein